MMYFYTIKNTSLRASGLDSWINFTPQVRARHYPVSMWGLSSFPCFISVYSPSPQTLSLICWVQTLSTGCYSSVSVFSLPKWWCAINLSLFLIIPHPAFKSCLCCRVYTQFISSQCCRICPSTHPVLWVSEGAFSSPQEQTLPPRSSSWCVWNPGK